VTFRSNDVFAALPHNLMGMRFIQDYVASALKVKLGTLTYNILSAHIREDNFLEAEAIVDLLNNRGYYYNTLGIYKEDVHSGSFLIAIEEQTITVVYKSYDSNSFMNQGTSAEFLTKQVLSRTPWITAQHAAYLGRELQKAEYCLKNGCEYKQS
jgi:thymidylate synthase